MKIVKYHMFAFYPYLLLEAEAVLENGDIVYPNICVPYETGKKIDENYAYYGEEWVYNCPLAQVDFEDDENYRYVLDEQENRDLFDALIQLWNQNPVFTPEGGWKEYKGDLS